MADAKPVDPAPHSAESSPKAAESSPKLVAVSEDKAEKGVRAPGSRSGPAGKGVSRTTVAILAVVLVLALAALYAQTRRASTQAEQIAQLGGQVEELQEQLSVAHTRLATYDMQFSMVQATVADLFQQMASLNALVNTDPFAPEPAEGGQR